jgi:hypothetical protein
MPLPLPDGPPPDVVAALADLRRRTRRRAWWRLAIGLVLAAVFGLLSLASYQAAELDAQIAAYQSPTGEGSGTYVVLWGPALFGGLMALRAGLVLWRTR